MKPIIERNILGEIRAATSEMEIMDNFQAGECLLCKSLEHSTYVHKKFPNIYGKVAS